jgi:catechol 2,3-dioxygenase-like lactoylglutathione lyase family enzyme
VKKRRIVRFARKSTRSAHVRKQTVKTTESAANAFWRIKTDSTRRLKNAFPTVCEILSRKLSADKGNTGMIDLKRSHLRILVKNFRQCFLFYRDVLELPVRYGDENADYAEFKTDALHIALFKRDFMAEVVDRADHPSEAPMQDRMAMILRVADTAKTFERLREKGVAFATPPTDRPAWQCRTAHFRDPDGNLIELNSDL